MHHLFIILNPWAGRGQAGQQRGFLEELLRDAELPYRLEETNYPGAAADLTRQALSQGYQRLVVVGGDGSLNEVVNTIMAYERMPGAPIAVGVVPIGTGNDFIQSLPGVTSDELAASVARLVAGELHPVDVGRVCVYSDKGEHTHYFINNLALGIDAYAAAASQRATFLKGAATYLAGAAWALLTYRPHTITFRLDDGAEVRQKYLLATVANGRRQGRAFWLTPEARIDDGQFDLCLVKPMRLWQKVPALIRAMHGSHTSLPEVQMLRASHISAHYKRPALVITDGEMVAKAALRLEVTLLPGALSLIA